MPRFTLKIPISTLSSGEPKLSISNDDWQRIESAYGHAVPTNARERIHEALLEFLRFVESEQVAHPVSEARKRVERVKKAATEFKTAIFEQDVGLDARTYANHLIKLHFRDARIRNSRDGLRTVAKLMTSVIVACNRALQDLKHPGNWGPKRGDTWEKLVRDLTAVLKRHRLPTEVRKDSDKTKTGKPSPLVSFMRELQSCLPPEHRRAEHSEIALADAIYRARRVGRVTKGDPSGL